MESNGPDSNLQFSAQIRIPHVGPKRKVRNLREHDVVYCHQQVVNSKNEAVAVVRCTTWISADIRETVNVNRQVFLSDTSSCDTALCLCDNGALQSRKASTVSSKVVPVHLAVRA